MRMKKVLQHRNLISWIACSTTKTETSLDIEMLNEANWAIYYSFLKTNDKLYHGCKNGNLTSKLVAA